MKKDESKTTNILEALNRKIDNVNVIEVNKPNFAKTAEAFYYFFKK